MLETTSVLGGGFCIDAYALQHVGKKHMAFVYLQGKFFTLPRQLDAPVVDRYVAAVAQLDHPFADGRLRIPHFGGYIDGAHRVFPLVEEVDGLEIHLGRFVHDHGGVPFPFPHIRIVRVFACLALRCFETETIAAAYRILHLL